MSDLEAGDNEIDQALSIVSQSSTDLMIHWSAVTQVLVRKAKWGALEKKRHQASGTRHFFSTSETPNYYSFQLEQCHTKWNKTVFIYRTIELLMSCQIILAYLNTPLQ